MLHFRNDIWNLKTMGNQTKPGKFSFLHKFLSVLICFYLTFPSPLTPHCARALFRTLPGPHGFLFVACFSVGLQEMALAF